jgi:hypothetical protein
MISNKPIYGIITRFDSKGNALEPDIEDLTTEEHKQLLDMLLFQNHPEQWIDPVPENWIKPTKMPVQCWEFRELSPEEVVACATKLKEDLEWLDNLAKEFEGYDFGETDETDPFK